MYTVSFCIPVYNAADTTYKLVKDMLTCDSEEFQIVISDNASEDKLLEKLSEINDSRLKVAVNEKNIGARANWLASLEAGDGEYLYFVIGRDMLNPKKIEQLIDVLKEAKSKGVQLLEDGPKRRIGLQASKFKVYEGLEAITKFVNCDHPSGIIYQREAFRQIKNRNWIFNLSSTYPENIIKLKLLEKDMRAAKISCDVYCGKTAMNLEYRKSSYQLRAKDKMPYWYPAKLLEANMRIINYALKMKLPENMQEEIIKEYYRKALHRVSFTWRNYWRDSTHAGHYSHELRKVSKIERISNILAVDKAFRHYYDRQIKGTMPSKLRVILWKQIWLTVKDKG